MSRAAAEKRAAPVEEPDRLEGFSAPREAEPVTPHLGRAVIVVELDIEQALAVLAPDRRAVGVLDAIRVLAAAVPFAHEDGEIFRSLNVRTPGRQAMVGRMPAAAEPEIVAGLRKFVAVEHDLVRAAISRLAAQHFMLSALAEFVEIGVRPVGRRYAGIVFLDAAAHLRDQLLLQGPGVAEELVGVGVLGFEIAADIGIEYFGIAQHLLPVRVFQPGIVVGDGNAVHGHGMRPARRDRRGQGGGLDGGSHASPRCV